MERFRNKYRIQSHRMPGWDYSGNGYYFITLVTQNRECNLGKIIDQKMLLSKFGQIVKEEWLKSFEIRNELLLDTYIIMPNHLHAIVVLDSSQNNENDDLIGIHGWHAHVETHRRASLQSTDKQSTDKQSTMNQTGKPFFRKPKSISSFVGGFKSAVNTKIDDCIDEYHLVITKYNKNNHFFQSNYHDHIIRNEKSYQTISDYIMNNPLNWDEDKLNASNMDKVK